MIQEAVTAGLEGQVLSSEAMRLHLRQWGEKGDSIEVQKIWGESLRRGDEAIWYSAESVGSCASHLT